MQGYQEYVVCFIDILGFKDLIKKESRNKILEVFSTIEANIKKLLKDDTITENKINITYCSDSTIISYDIKNKNQLVFILLNLQEMIKDLVSQNILIRGAITIGDLFHQENQIFGPALVNAIEIESQVAIYPRIIINKSVLLLEKFEQNFEEISKKRIQECVAEDESDGWHYINYIDFDFSLFQNIEEYIEYLTDLLQLISNNSNKNIVIKTKYTWLNKKINKALNNLLLENKDTINGNLEQAINSLIQKCKKNTVQYSIEIFQQGKL